MFGHVSHWLVHQVLHFSGMEDGDSPWYLLWSGVFAAIEGLSFFAVAFAGVRHLNCHVTGCWRVGHLPTDGGHKVCKKHHPSGGISHAHVLAAHAAAHQGALRGS